MKVHIDVFFNFYGSWTDTCICLYFYTLLYSDENDSKIDVQWWLLIWNKQFLFVLWVPYLKKSCVRISWKIFHGCAYALLQGRCLCSPSCFITLAWSSWLETDGLIFSWYVTGSPEIDLLCRSNSSPRHTASPFWPLQSHHCFSFQLLSRGCRRASYMLSVQCMS